MRSNVFTHLRDEDLLRKLSSLLSQERMTTAELLAVMAEVDARKLYVPEGYSSMFAFCVEKLHLSEDAAYKRIQASRAARRFPALLDAIIDGRLHLTAVRLLAPHLNDRNVQELIQQTTHRRKSEIEEILACRFGRPDPPTRITPIALIPAAHLPSAPATTGTLLGASMQSPELAPGQVQEDRGEPMDAAADSSDIAHIRTETARTSDVQAELRAADNASPSARVGRYFLQCPISKETHGLLRYAQTLLSHAVPDGEMDQVLQRALKALITQLEKKKVAVLTGPSASGSSGVVRSKAGRRRPRIKTNSTPSDREGLNERHIPASVRRAVWHRDKGQCTFVGAGGHRCNATSFLEYDHVEPVARGGVATVRGMRLRCRAHNQYEAERVFGAAFMSRKRDEARVLRAKRRRDREVGGTKQRRRGLEIPADFVHEPVAIYRVRRQEISIASP